MERVILQAKATTTTHVRWISDQIYKALDNVSFSAIEMKAVTPKLILFDGCQLEDNRTELNFLVNFNGFVGGLHLVAIKFNFHERLFFRK